MDSTALHEYAETNRTSGGGGRSGGGEGEWEAGAPAHGRPGGQWSVFLLWILWTWGEPMSMIGKIFHL